MKFITLIAMIASQVLAVNYIQESLFGGQFSLAPQAIVLESGPAGNMTVQYGNMTFTGRTVSNTEIVDKYAVESKGKSIGTALRTLSAHPALMGMPMGSGPYLETKFEINLEEEEALEGMDFQTSSNADSLKIRSFQLVFDDASSESNVSEVYTNQTGLIWKILPGPLINPSYSRMEQGGLIDTPFSRFMLNVFPFPATKAELKAYAVIPNGSGLINIYDPEIVIVAATETTAAPEEEGEEEEEGNDDEDEEDDDEEEEEPEQFLASNIKLNKAPAVAAA
ncbi:hypothetical protein NEMIN01_1102 [Nematocida minor]|uniref:uncharacterized protein n=1 Tax=Nematocida minor TaxID=1912983 RepID=UPI00221EC41D|nr:uncharacterized protein NEMIN01_1102 [Nematocida minor]KAI5190564.1 hypothetical protein NEMIN01_1102 [Nematocida minor]